MKAQIKRADVTYAQLVERLGDLGVTETVSSLKGKLHRGTFSFVFVLQVMQALDRDRLSIR